MEMRYIAKQDPEYPPQLRPYERMPAGLYVIGNLPDPEKKCVAIVGARKCSRYGYSEAVRFGSFLAEHGVQVISGLAYGCDAAGHEGALKSHGKTFAVLGCGADICYPRANIGIYEQILAEGGGILSEYEPGTPPEAWHFPIRNRIISAFSDVVLVIEARRRSGSLITVDYALEQGKPVYAIPGRNRDQASAGCNHLIAEGAGIAISPSLILDELGIKEEQSEPGKSGPEAKGQQTGEQNVKAEGAEAEIEKRILQVMSFDEQDVAMIAGKAGIGEADAGRILLELCHRERVCEVVPGYFTLY